MLTRSISSCSTRRSTFSSSGGLEVTCIFTMAEASSTRSMALSGRKRSVMYLLLSTAAATSARSEIRTPWCSSYRALRPRSTLKVSASVGSATNTCWKRRSRAASFSMCCRYSSNVVAPTHRRSPRASMGFKMFPASMAPPEAPAPTMRCISSMKVITLPSESLISFSTAFSRSSNSPRYLAPATMAPMSREITCLSFRASGTSPSTMRRARPSTMAVLPTPGSPMITGLFLERRAKICTTRRISSSRPMTGSSLPSRASAVRSEP
mmetsp:Transcript_23381/g.55543  ORF Transcript_23381/g.55543 Transcript_23381/m.55543 type:complete len:266 (-) Transcript_23381:684-1481(-)